MEVSDPLSQYVLDILQQDEQIDWTQLQSSDFVDNTLYINSNSSSSPPNVNSSPEIQSLHTSDQVANDDDNSDDNETNQKNKRKRRQIKTQCEANRRVKFNEQLATLRALVLGDQGEAKAKKGSKITREALLSSAIDEISKLRHQLAQTNKLLTTTKTDAADTNTPLTKVGTGVFPMFYNLSGALFDPYNRASYTTQDLDRAFQTMFAREIESLYSSHMYKPEHQMMNTLKLLQEVSNQLGKLEYQLNVGVLEQMYYANLKFNPKELRRVLEQNWNGYQTLRKTDRDNLVLFVEGEIGTWVLTDMALLEYLCGNFEASERTFGYAKELTKKFKHRGTNHFMLANHAFSLRGAVSVATAEKVSAILKHNSMWCQSGQLILSMALVASGRHQEGLETLETATSTMLGRGEPVDLCMAPLLLEAYTVTRQPEKGIMVANYVLKKYNELNIEGYMGKAELLRQKAALLMIKKYPDYAPDAMVRFVDSSLEDIISLCEEDSNAPIVSPFGPVEYPLTHHYQSVLTPDTANEDIEMILRSALNMAQIKGLHMTELRCTVDLTWFFVHSGDINQAVETVQLVKGCMEKMKGPSDARELQKARYVISMVEQRQRAS